MPRTPRITSRTKVPLYVAVHEAGHAAANWLLGGTPYAVHIPHSGRLPQDRRGRDVHAGGFHESGFPYNIFPGAPPAHVRIAQMNPEEQRTSRLYGLACAVMTLAGGYAEARYRRVAWFYTWFDGAADDVRHVENISRDLFVEDEEQKRFWKTASSTMLWLMRGRLPAIVRIAKVLHASGSLVGDDLDAVLTAELGERPNFMDAFNAVDLCLAGQV
jgi:hypothetical protein